MPEVLLNTGDCFSVRLRAPLTGSLDISSYYMSNFICDYCKSLLERGIEGGYNFLSALLATETCSEMNRALEHFELLHLVDNEQFFVTFLDMPFKVTDNTVRHYVDQLRRKVLEPLYDELSEAFINGTADKDYLAGWRRRFEDAMTAAGERLDAMADAAGVDLDSESGTSQSGKSGSFNAMSQEQGTKLEGMFTSGLMHWSSMDEKMSDVSEQMGAAVDSLRRIEENTGNSARHLGEIKEDIKKIIRDGLKMK